MSGIKTSSDFYQKKEKKYGRYLIHLLCDSLFRLWEIVFVKE